MGEEAGASDTFTQMAEASAEAAVEQTKESLRKAGYKEQPDGTFHGPWFNAKITSEPSEGMKNERKVEYTRHYGKAP